MTRLHKLIRLSTKMRQIVVNEAFSTESALPSRQHRRAITESALFIWPQVLNEQFNTCLLNEDTDSPANPSCVLRENSSHEKYRKESLTLKKAWYHSVKELFHLHSNMSYQKSYTLIWFNEVLLSFKFTKGAINEMKTRDKSSEGQTWNLFPLESHWILGWQEWNPIWSSAVVAHLPQSWTCCVFRYAFLLSAAIKSDYWNYLI